MKASLRWRIKKFYDPVLFAVTNNYAVSHFNYFDGCEV
jgi:hypothetical protein